MMKSGIYDNAIDGSLLYDYNWRPTNFFSAQSWSKDTVLRLNKICEEIEASEDFNPGGKLTLPRRGGAPVGEPAAPWLWVLEHMFIDNDWHYLACEFAYRLKRMDEKCDWKNDHSQESNETLFLTCVVLWFQTGGGKDEILGLRMTVFVRHALRYSIGRALRVEPGSLMVSGWTVKHPTSLSQYDDSRRTITVETWMMNRGKPAYSTDPDTIATWTQAIRDIPRTSRFWDFRSLEGELKAIDWPREWRKAPTIQRTVAAGRIEELTDEDEADNVFSDVDPEEDNEGLVMLGTDAASEDGNDKPEPKPAMTQSELNDDAEFFATMANPLPEDQQQRFNKTFMKWALRIGSTLLGDTEYAAADQEHEMRVSLFTHAIVYYVTDFQHDIRFTLDELVSIPIETWRSLMDDIETPFTRGEIILICLRLDKEGKLK